MATSTKRPTNRWARRNPHDRNHFLVEDALECGFMARALDASIYTDAENLDDLHCKVNEAVDCHFEPNDKPKMIRLHFVREDVIAT
jgi:hypothetical protein